MPAKKITLTETELPAADAEMLACYLAAHRAKKQAEAILKKLSKRVLKLTKDHPSLLFDGARVTGGKMVVWNYDECKAVRNEQLLLALVISRAQSCTLGHTDGAVHEGQYSGAIARLTEFPQVRELAKFAKQTPQPETPGIFRSLFSNRKS